MKDCKKTQVAVKTYSHVRYGTPCCWISELEPRSEVKLDF